MGVPDLPIGIVVSLFLFDWPAGVGDLHGICFHAALLNTEMTRILGTYDFDECFDFWDRSPSPTPTWTPTPSSSRR